MQHKPSLPHTQQSDDYGELSSSLDGPDADVHVATEESGQAVTAAELLCSNSSITSLQKCQLACHLIEMACTYHCIPLKPGELKSQCMRG